MQKHKTNNKTNTTKNMHTNKNKKRQQHTHTHTQDDIQNNKTIQIKTTYNNTKHTANTQRNTKKGK